MTAFAPPTDTGAAIARRAGDVWADRTFRTFALVAGLFVLAVLALITYSTTTHAWPAFRHMGFEFVGSRNWDPNTGHFGTLDFIFGTVLTSFIALVFAVPLSLGIALFVTEIASQRLRRWVTYVVDLLAAIPSVVYGFWALYVFTKPVSNVYQHIADTLGKAPILASVFGGSVQGACFMTAGIILAVMITPIITSLARETLLTVAQDDKNAALAMGATRWEMLQVAVFPRVRSGLVGAVMLGLGRALGETIAVALVIGTSHQVTSHLFHSGDAMAAIIAHNWGESTGDYRAALVGLGVVLFVITIVVNMAARAVANRNLEAGR